MKDLDLIKRLTAEARLNNLLRQIMTLTQDCRPSDVEEMCDRLNQTVQDIHKKQMQRTGKIPFPSLKQTKTQRKDDPPAPINFNLKA